MNDIDDEEEKPEPEAEEESEAEVKQRRKRADAPRSITIDVNGRRHAHLRLKTIDDSYERGMPYWRPKTRADCAEVERPCLFVACKYNLFFEVVEGTGSVKITYPDRDPDDVPPHDSCALDIADRGGETLERVGELLNVTRERVRQIEERTLVYLRHLGLRKKIILDEP